MNRKLRKTFCNVLNGFKKITFDQIKASLLNKSINFIIPPPSKINTHSKLLNSIVYNVTKAFHFR